jgi:hypothetical protein
LQERLAHKQASHFWRIGLIMFAISGAIFESDYEAEANELGLVLPVASG